MATTHAAPVDEAALIEQRSIDYIPRAERHGKAWHQGTFWFASNAEIATLAVGLIGISLGLSLAWSLLAIVVGLAFGTLFMASHSVQGARLGLPQMIQTRPQFGFMGALWPQTIVLFLYVGFNVFNLLLAGSALNVLTGISTDVGIVLAAIAGLALSYGGYRWLHAVQRWGTAAFLICFGFFTIGMLVSVDIPDGPAKSGPFDLTAFLIVVFACASYVISEAPYVSDYSRYLRPSTSSRACFSWTYAGAALGGLWMIGLGAYLLAAFPEAAPAEVIKLGGDAIFDGFGTIALTLALLMLLPTVAANMYGGSLTAITMRDSVKRITPTRRLRLVGLVVVGACSTVLAIVSPDDFLTDYSNFLTILLYFMVPWTAVNLVDFYVIRNGDYAIAEIFKRNGVYGRWNWRGLVAYAIGLLVMVPFFSTPWYTGPVADAVDGADLSIFVGLPVAAILYWSFARGLDRGEEQQLARSNDDEAAIAAADRAEAVP